MNIFKAECNVIFTECGQIVSFNWIFYCRRILVIVSPLVTYWFKEAKVREYRVLELPSAWPSYHSSTFTHPLLRTVTRDFKHHYHVFDLYFHLCIVDKFIAAFVTHGESFSRLELCTWEKIRADSFKNLTCWLVSQLQDALFLKICTNCSHQDSR